MSGTPPPPVSEIITVTAHRRVTEDDTGGGDTQNYVTYNDSPWMQGIFDQFGGDETPQTTTFWDYEGEIIVLLPGYSFTPRVSAESWAEMSRDQRATFMKMMTEFRDSPRLVAAFDLIESNRVGRVDIRYDNVIHRLDGTTELWPVGKNGFIDYQAAAGSGGVNIINGTNIIITINSNTMTSARDFGVTLAHEFRHPILPGMDDLDEEQAEDDGEDIYREILRRDGITEADPLSQFDGITFAGSRYNDVATGTSADDTLAGLSGNDTLSGGAGNDLLMGGAGMDVLQGGLGSNSVEGGLDADTYVPTAGVIHEQVIDIGGVDRLDLSSVSINDALFRRIGDSLFISVPGLAVEGVAVAGQWIDQSRIEQFTFAEGTFGASYIEQLAGEQTGVCYENGFPEFCSPYGMPVVLDLDGDGVELIELAQSHTRFDVDGDGRTERVGWVGSDDGILALDRNGNGRIDDFSEISFRNDFLGAGSDLEGLLAYDTNRDGFLSAADVRFADFLVWRDLNGNGKSEKSELYTLQELDIVSIGLERRGAKYLDEFADKNQILATSTFETADGRQHLLGDVALYADMKFAVFHGAIQNSSLFDTISQVAVDG